MPIYEVSVCYTIEAENKKEAGKLFKIKVSKIKNDNVEEYLEIEEY